MVSNRSRLERAYDKVGLYADSAWAVDRQDNYFHANQELWLRKHSMKLYCERTGGPRSVIDTIPNSKLATYGSFIYNEERENMYILDFPYEQSEVPCKLPRDRWLAEKECWMIPGVEKVFDTLKDISANPSELEQRCMKIVNDDATSVKHHESYFSFTANEQTDNTYQPSNFRYDSHQNVPFRKYRRISQCTKPPHDATNFHELVLQMQLHSNEVRSAWSKDPSHGNPTMDRTFNTNNNGNTSAEDPTKNYDVLLAPDLKSWPESYSPIRQEYLKELYVIADIGEKYEKEEGSIIPLPSYSPPHWIKEFPVLHSQTPNHSSSGRGRRLYSAVLQNVMSADCEEFDDLERQALEQYRSSEESLDRGSSDSIISAKFQELERQAMEQYCSSSNENCAIGDTDSSTSIPSTSVGTGNLATPLYEPPFGGLPTPYAALMLTNSVLASFYRSLWAQSFLTYLRNDLCRLE
ncbi:hypothetical protein CBL_08715 [Carabus blaptoides fortunei]